MAEVWVLVPVSAIAFLFITIILVTKYITQHRSEARRLSVEGGGDYRRLAEEAVQGQRVLLDEVRRMNATLAEIERVLKEV